MATIASAKNQAASAVDSVKDDIQSGAAEVADKAKSTARDVKRGVGDIEASLTRSAEDIAATVSGQLRAVGVDTDHLVDVAREQAGDLQKMIEDEIRERPLRALGVAAAIGLFVGFLSAR